MIMLRMFIYSPNVEELKKSGKINGIMVPYFYNETTLADYDLDPPVQDSPDHKCPNRQHSMYETFIWLQTLSGCIDRLPNIKYKTGGAICPCN